ncbi:sulfite exporter TauE/SafE family protein [Halogeometricum borinquense]|uniref:Probable membrane transporter protein n=1 Tax=Halogeometricum borinquense TaxID=60847 RepID=A0A6C0UQH1_9EURY|nr:sulfite exporter TauE/SafE family protein [Halogeometricum borinquense]QIB75198.1 sulfite exporter TauE/SafE family protein [Halogeometricum borinquense]
MAVPLGGESISLSLALAIAAIVAFGGFVTGLNGFGFAVIGTALLAFVMEPQTAVALMILPILAANTSLIRELDRESLSSCVRRFWPYVGTAVIGTVLGMLSLSLVPQRPLALGLGLFVLAYVALSQNRVEIPGTSSLRRRCFVETGAMKALLGFVSGAIFGASNVGVQVVAYLRRLELDRQTFVGVVAMIFLGISVVRVGTAAALGLYDSVSLFAVSAVAAVPGLAGVAVGKRIRPSVPESLQRAATFTLLVIIGVRLTLSGAGV